jgi:ribonucleoside-diphosphate reductase alpha chain
VFRRVDFLHPKNTKRILKGSIKVIKINKLRDKDITEFGLETLKRDNRYMLENEESPQEAFARAASAYASNEEHAQRIYDYASKRWFMFSSPILSNGGTDRGLPISCFLNHVEDSRDGLTEHYAENMWLSTMGGGIGSNWSQIRSNGESTSTGNKTTGVIPFMHVVDSLMLAANQGSTRRGACATYLDISHPEIEEFIDMRKPTVRDGGDFNRRNLNLHHGVNISDAFMEACENGSEWSLVDPNSGKVHKKIPARELWVKLLESRVETGEPFFHFIDTSNREMPLNLQKLGLRINHSNLCSEIYLPTNNQRTAVCCLSSVNLEKFDEWSEDDMFIRDLVEYLDNVLQSFIDTAPSHMHKAVFSASQERSIGLGAMGFHSFLQSKGVPFESALAVSWNKKMFGHIKRLCDVASLELGKERGEAPDMKGTGHRFAHRTAIAPNATSGNICGTSPSIEPWKANGFRQDTLSGAFPVKNKYLDKLLKEEYNLYGEALESVWSSIFSNGGSVMHLEFMEDYHKEVFKTALELDQRWIVQHAGDRQPFICQGQSVNLFFRADADKLALHAAHFLAWKKGLKGLYYCRSQSVKQAEKVSDKVEREVREDYKNVMKMDEDVCLACSG